jgi:hypothetical protein
MARTGLQARYLAVLRELGGHAGNGRMRDALGWQEGTYAKISEELRRAGLVSAGRGRGGSVSLAETINGSEPDGAETKLPLELAFNGGATQARSGEPTMSKRPMQQNLPLLPAEISGTATRKYEKKLSQQQLEAHLWGAANILRGKTGGQDYKNYILSLMFYKRLCDQWECEADEAIAELEKEQQRSFSEHEKAIFRRRGEHRFKIPDGYRWGDVKAVSIDIGKVLTKAMKAVAEANEELLGVFTVDWGQPAPDGSGKPLIANEVVHALIQHFDEHDLSNRNVPSDILGRAYEYLIKKFADDAGAKAGEFFTPPEVVDTLVRILEPQPGDTIYDPTTGSGGMLVRAADYLREIGHRSSAARYFGQEMNWGNAAIAKINSVLHGLEADIKAGSSTITDPLFLEAGSVKKFSLVLANFPFSDEFWWLKPQQQTDDKKKREKLKKETFTNDGYKDPFGRFGRGTPCVLWRLRIYPAHYRIAQRSWPCGHRLPAGGSFPRPTRG